MDKIKDVAQRMGIITVEDMERYTALELIMMIANKINGFNEVIMGQNDILHDFNETLNDQNDTIQYMLDEGLLLEIGEVFDEWLEDGTFNTLINKTGLKKVNDRIDESKAQLSQEINVERKRIDSLNTLQAGSTTGDAELQDIRIGHNGTTYSNAGTAVREQIKQIASKIITTTNVLFLDNLTKDFEINPQTGELRTAMGWRATEFIPIEPNNYIYVYKQDGAYKYGASCFWAVYDSDKKYITGSVTDAAGVDFINASDARVAYIRASFGNARLAAEPMIVPKTYYSKLENYLPPFKGVLLKGSPYLTESNSPFEIDIRKRRIVAPKNVAVVMGNQFDIHYDNVLLGADARLMPYKNYYGSAPAVHMKDMLRIDSLQTSATTKVDFRILNDGFVDYEQPLGDLMLHKDLYIVPVSKTAGSGMTRNVMFIGDSITANGLYVKEVANLFTNDEMNVNLIGTVKIGGVPHEGHGGWTSKDFCETTSFNDYTNAFYNPATRTFDFSYYMSTNKFESVDDVFINLGINDMAKNLGLENIIRYYNKMVNSIRAYNPKIRIFIGLCILPYSGKYSTAHNYTQFSKSQRLALHERLIEEYDERESEGIFVVPFNLTIDTENDFKFVEKPLSHRNNEVMVKYCTDVTHPSTVAYNKMADMAYWYIKYKL